MSKFFHAALVVQAALLQCPLPLGRRSRLHDDIQMQEVDGQTEDGRSTFKKEDCAEDGTFYTQEFIKKGEKVFICRNSENGQFAKKKCCGEAWHKFEYPVVSLTHNAGGELAYLDEIAKVTKEAKFFEEDDALLGMVCLQEAPGVRKEYFESNEYAKMLASNVEKPRAGQEWKHLVLQTQDGGTTAGLNHQSLAVFVRPPGDFQWVAGNATASKPINNASSTEEKEFMCLRMHSKTFGVGRACYHKTVQRNSYAGKGAAIAWIRYEDAARTPQFEVVVGCSHLDAGKQMNVHTRKILAAMGPADGGPGLDTRIILGDLNFRLPDRSIKTVLKGESEATSSEIIDAITRHMSGKVSSSDEWIDGTADLKDADPLTRTAAKVVRGELVRPSLHFGAGFTCNSVDFLPPTYKFPKKEKVVGWFGSTSAIVGTRSPECQFFFLRAFAEQQNPMEYRGGDAMRDLVSSCFLERKFADPENEKVWPNKKKKTQVQLGWLDRFCWHATREPTENTEFSKRAWIAGRHVTSDHFPTLSKVTFKGVPH